MALSDLRVFVFAERAAAADGAGGSSAAAGSVLARSAARSAQARVCPLRLPAAFRKNGEKILAGIKHAPKNSAKSTHLTSQTSRTRSRCLSPAVSVASA